MINNITKSIDLRINLHKAYTDNVIGVITNKITSSLNCETVHYNPNRMDILVKAVTPFNDSDIKSLVNETILSLTTYEHPEMLYTIARLSPTTVIIEL